MKKLFILLLISIFLISCTPNEITILTNIIKVSEAAIPLIPIGAAEITITVSALGIVDDLLNGGNLQSGINNFKVLLPQLEASNIQEVSNIAKVIQTFINNFQQVTPAPTKSALAKIVSSKDKTTIQQLHNRILLDMTKLNNKVRKY